MEIGGKNLKINSVVFGKIIKVEFLVSSVVCQNKKRIFVLSHLQ